MQRWAAEYRRQLRNRLDHHVRPGRMQATLRGSDAGAALRSG